MGKTVKLVKKVIVLLISAVLLLAVDRWLALSSIGTFIEKNYELVISKLLQTVFWIDLAWVIYDILRYFSCYSSKRMWDKTVKDLEIGIGQNMKADMDDTYDPLNAESLYFLMSYEKSTMDNLLLQKLKQNFEKEGENSLRKEEISYLFLANKSNKSIAEFCNTPDGNLFLQSCEQCSQKVVTRTTFTCKRIDFSSGEFKAIINEFLHLSLPNGAINTDEKIDYIRKVLSWIRLELRNKNSFRDADFQMFMMVLAKVERNLFYHNVTDKMIHTYIKKIKTSWHFRRMYWNANRRLWSKKTNTIYAERMCDVGLIVAYIRKFGLVYRTLLRLVVYFKLEEYELEYHKNYKDAMAILVLATPLSNIKMPDENYADKVLTIINAVGGSK